MVITKRNPITRIGIIIPLKEILMSIQERQVQEHVIILLMPITTEVVTPFKLVLEVDNTTSTAMATRPMFPKGIHSVGNPK